MFKKKDKNADVRPTFLIISLLLFSFFIILVSADPLDLFGEEFQSNSKLGNLSQINLGKQWVVTKSDGEEGKLTFWSANLKDKKTEIGFILPEGEKCNDWKTSLNVYDDSGNILKNSVDEKDIKPLTCESAKCDGEDCYHLTLTTTQSSNLQDLEYIKLGENSIITEYQDINLLNYNLSFAEANITLFKNISNEWINNIEDLFVYYNEDSYKFGANDTTEGLSRYKYKVESTNNIYPNRYKPYVQDPQIRKIQNGLISYTTHDNHVFDFSDICTRTFNCHNETIENETFEVCEDFADCDFLYSTEGNLSVLEVEFTSDKFIDPTITITDDEWIISATLDNVTAESGASNYSHLTVSEESPYDSLVGYWSADGDLADTELTTAYDWSGEGNDGTMAGNAVATSSAGKYGKGFEFDGDGDYVNLGIPSVGENVTISFWEYSSSNNGNDGYFMGDSEQPSNFYIRRFAGGDNEVTGAIGGDDFHKSDIGTIYVEVWNYIVVTNNGSTAKFYLNGVLKETITDSNFNGFDSEVYIGNRNEEDRDFNGSIDEVMIFNTSLTQEQITAIYNNQSARFKNGGTEDIEEINMSELGTENRANVTINECQRLLGSNLSAQIGINNGNGYDYNGSIVYFNSSCVATNLTIEGNPVNTSLRIIFEAGDYDFYSPILEGDVTIESWVGAGEEEPVEQSINISLLNPTLTNGNYNATQNEFFRVDLNVTCLTGECGTVNVSLDPKTIKYTPTTKTECENGICNKILYSGTKYINEDNTWKRIEEARSLKNSGIECKINSDGENLVECLDWNYTSVTLKLEKKNGGSSPIRVMEYDEEKIKQQLESGKLINELIYSDKYTEKERIDYNFKDSKEQKEIIVQANYGDEIHFGEHSTTIQLQDNETDNLEDTVTLVNDVSDYGSETSMYTGYAGGGSAYSYIKFNLSSINSAQVIESNLNLFVSTNAYDTGETGQIFLYEVDNISWSEDDLNYYNRIPFGFLLNSSREIDGDEDDFWISLDSTSWVSSNINNDAISFGLNGTTEGSSDYFGMRTKEYTTVDERPYLNITYSDTKSGLIPIEEDWTTEPFYTNATSNPLTTSSLSAGQSETITFYVNATGDGDTIHDFFAFANITNNMTITNETDHWNVTIIESAEEDSCSYTSGDWNVDCSDNCIITETVDLGGNNINIIGTGTFITTANITNFNTLHIEGTDTSNICKVSCIGGCFV